MPTFSRIANRAAQALWKFARTSAARLIVPALVATCALPTFAQARWLRAESPLFVIYSEGKEAELREYTRRLEEYDGLLRTVTGTTQAPSPNKLTIYLVKDNKQLREVTPRVSDDVQGLYLALASGTIATAVRKDLGGKDWLSAQSIIFHEYTHHFVYQYYPANYPNWTSEGLAEYFSGVTFKPKAVELGKFQMARVFPLKTRPWMPVAKLFNPPKTSEGMGMYYPESWLVTHYMMDDPDRQKKLTAFLEAVGRGEESEAAFQRIFNMGYTDFDKVMKDYLSKGKVLIRQYPRRNAEPEVTITALPASADKMLLVHARFMADSLTEQDDADMHFGHEDLIAVRKDAAKFPGDALALRTVAAAEMLYGDLAATDAALDQVLAKDPADVEALYLKAARYVVEGRDNPAQRKELLAKAKPIAGEIYKRDPNHYPALYLYALGALATSDKPSENTLNVLKLAHQLAPQVDEISLEAAVALSNAGDPVDARRLLELVAYAPHATQRSTYARALLSQVATGMTIEHVPGEMPARIVAPK